MTPDFGDLSNRVLSHGPGALTLDEACWLIAKAKDIPALLADRDEGWRQHNKAVCALAGLMSEFRVIEKEFTRLKREYEPPYVAYASYAMPEAIRVARAASRRPEVGEQPGGPGGIRRWLRENVFVDIHPACPICGRVYYIKSMPLHLSGHKPDDPDVIAWRKTRRG